MHGLDGLGDSAFRQVTVAPPMPVIAARRRRDADLGGRDQAAELEAGAPRVEARGDYEHLLAPGVVGAREGAGFIRGAQDSLPVEPDE